MLEKHELFCWECHESNGRKGEVYIFNCCNCKRSFHGPCLKTAEERDDVPSNWLCPVCAELQEAERNVKPNELILLPIIMKRVLADKTYKSLVNSDSVDVSMANPLNLSLVNAKMETYKSLAEFRADIQCIVHNCQCINGNSEKVKVANLLLAYVDIEIESLQNCSECYENSDNHPENWFTMICAKPHLIALAEKEIQDGQYFGDHTYDVINDGKRMFILWPAKILSDDDHLKNVQFFGDHSYAVTTSTNFLLPPISMFIAKRSNSDELKITENTPSRSYEVALKETKAYIKNIGNRLGSFVMAQPSGLIDLQLFNRHIREGAGNNQSLPVESEAERHETISGMERDATNVEMEIDTSSDDYVSNHLDNNLYSEPSDCNANQNTPGTLNGKSDENSSEDHQSLKRSQPSYSNFESDEIPTERVKEQDDECVAVKKRKLTSQEDFLQQLKKVIEDKDQIILASENYARTLLEKCTTLEKINKDLGTQIKTLINEKNKIITSTDEKCDRAVSEMKKMVIAEKNKEIETHRTKYYQALMDLEKVIHEKNQIIAAKDNERSSTESKLLSSEKHNRDLLRQIQQLSDTNKNLEKHQMGLNEIIVRQVEQRNHVVSEWQNGAVVQEQCKKECPLKRCADCGAVFSTGLFLCNMKCLKNLCEKKSKKPKYKIGNKTDKYSFNNMLY